MARHALMPGKRYDIVELEVAEARKQIRAATAARLSPTLRFRKRIAIQGRDASSPPGYYRFILARLCRFCDILFCPR